MLGLAFHAERHFAACVRCISTAAHDNRACLFRPAHNLCLAAANVQAFDIICGPLPCFLLILVLSCSQVHLFTATDAARNPALGSAAKAFMSSRWRMSWMDTTSQPEVCSFHFPKSSSSGQSADIHSRVCGRSWWTKLWRASYAFELFFPSKLHAISSSHSSSGVGSSGSAVHVMVFQPSGEWQAAVVECLEFGTAAPLCI